MRHREHGFRGVTKAAVRLRPLDHLRFLYHRCSLLVVELTSF
jgi:hypothetical protein